MSRPSLLASAIVALAILVGVCYGPAILGKQFAFRDAAHFYYPLYQRVEAEWDAGRWPLWEPEENGGMPLLGNPTAAVLYPGKILFRVMPYPLAARWYVIAHTLLATAGAAALARGLGIGGVGSVIAGSAYGFGGPVLFQYCNIIYLVGAGWLPWALTAVDAWLRRGRRWAIGALSVALAMQVLGGEPQSAYLVGLCAGAYALVLARAERNPQAESPWLAFFRALGVVALIGAWFAFTIALAWYLPIIRPRRPQPPTLTFPWTSFVPTVVAACWALAGIWMLARWRNGRRNATALGRRLAGLAVAAGIAGLLVSAQLLPVLEFAGRTGRASDESAHDIYPFSLEPYRVVELLLPNVFGTMQDGNHLWINLLPPRDNHKIWVDSLYMGAATLVLALVGLGGKGGPPWRRWLIGVAAVSLIGAFGEFLSPIWIARHNPEIARRIGPHDPAPTNAIRLDGYLRDGDGSPYHLLAVALPGFGQFRYPSKLLTLTVLSLAILAGHGWDRVGAGARRSAVRWTASFLAITVATAIGVALTRPSILAWMNAADIATLFGPLDAQGAFRDILTAALQPACVLAALLGVLGLADRSPRGAAVAVLLIVAADLAMANRRLIAVTDQAEFERVPKALQLIADAEKAAPSPGPFRVHRMPVWQPSTWRQAGSPGRYRDFVRWERDTLQPKYGITAGVQYTFTHGVAELYDHEWFFSPWTVRVEPAMAHRLGTDPKERVVYYPRRGFDMWGTRYFILPGIPQHTNPDRGIAAFSTDVERIYPTEAMFEGPDAPKLRENQARTEDLQILRNRDAMPRAWVVHNARLSKPIEGLTRAERADRMEEILYMGDPFWSDPERHPEDPRSIAWLEIADYSGLNRFIPGGPTAATEAVTVREVAPRRVELDVTLERPGIVVLADVYYPGWTLTLDDKPAPILRANRMMRGAAVDTGRHRLVYEYHPRSFAIGGLFSLFGLVGLAVLSLWSARGPSSNRRSFALS